MARRLWLEYGVYFLLCQLLEMFSNPEEIQIENNTIERDGIKLHQLHQVMYVYDRAYIN